MDINNFKKLEEIELAESDFNNQLIRAGISSNISTFRFVGDMLEHFIPNVISIFVNMVGGDSKKTPPRRPKYPNTPS